MFGLSEQNEDNEHRRSIIHTQRNQIGTVRYAASIESKRRDSYLRCIAFVTYISIDIGIESKGKARTELR
jgi:hypothetical protein